MDRNRNHNFHIIYASFGGVSGHFYEAEATGIAEDIFRPRIKEITKHGTTYLDHTIVDSCFSGPVQWMV